MASTLPNPTVKFNILRKRLLSTTTTNPTPAPPFLLLFLLLLLSLFLALFLLHIVNNLPHVRPPLLHHFLSPFLFNTVNHQGWRLLSTSTLVHQYLSFLLSPFPIFILANLIIFTLLFKTFYLSSSPSTSLNSSAVLSDFSDFNSEKFDHGGPRLPKYAVPRHEDFFFSSPPHARYILSSDPSEEYHILAFESSEESTHFDYTQSFNKLNDEWEEVHRVYMGSYVESKVGNGVFPEKELKRPHKVHSIVEKAQASREGSAEEKGGSVEGKTSRSPKGTAASNCFTLMQAPSQAVVINMEPPPAPAVRRPRTSTPPSPSPPKQAAIAKVADSSVPCSYQPTSKVIHPPPTPSMKVTHPPPPMQRPPSSPRAKKGTGAPTSDHQSRACIAKPTPVKRSTNPHQSIMIRSYSDQRLSHQLLRSPDASSPPSLTNRPQVHKPSRGRSAIDNLLTSSSSLTPTRPRMQRTHSLQASSSPAYENTKAPPSSPTFSEALDALSDADANIRFSNFIAHRFSLMKKELDVY